MQYYIKVCQARVRVTVHTTGYYNPLYNSTPVISLIETLIATPYLYFPAQVIFYCINRN